MSRATNCTTPGYLVVMIIARNSCDSKSFPVCGHLCGQSCFLARFPGQAKSRKRPCFKDFRVSAVLVMDEKAYAPKAGALPSALHPVIQFLSGWAYSPQKPRCKMDAVSRSGAEYALSTPRMRPPSCPDAPLCRALKCLCASGCKVLPFLRSPPPGLPAFFATPTGRCRAKASLGGLRPNRAGTSCKQSFYSFAAKTLYTIL